MAIIYAMGASGFVRSDDGGQTWFAPEPDSDIGCSSGRRVGQILPLHTSDDLVYASSTAGVLRSNDRGATWANVSIGLPEPLDLLASLTIDTTNSDRLIVLAAGVPYITTNGGGQWALLSQGLDTVRLGNLVLAQSGDLYGATDSAIYRFPADGSAWERVAAAPLPQTVTPPQIPGLAIDTSADEHIVLLGYEGISIGLPDVGRAYLPQLVR